MLFVDRVAKGFRRLERRRLRRRDGDRLPGSGIASLTPGARLGRRTSRTPRWRPCRPVRALRRWRRTRHRPSARRQPGSWRSRRQRGRRARLWSCCSSLERRLDFGGWDKSTLSVPRPGRACNRRYANARAAPGVDETITSASTRPFRSGGLLGTRAASEPRRDVRAMLGQGGMRCPAERVAPRQFIWEPHQFAWVHKRFRRYSIGPGRSRMRGAQGPARAGTGSGGGWMHAEAGKRTGAAAVRAGGGP